MIEKVAPTILVIDDETSIRNSFRDYLEDRDYRVLTAENGRVGIEVFDHEKPDLVMVDLRMPEVDGLEVLTRVKELSPNTPLIVVSGTGVITDVIEALHLGAWDYIIKPVNDLQVLLHAVEKGLERAQLKARERDYQKRLQEEVNRKTRDLRKSEKQYRMLAENISDVIWTTDLESRFTYLSPSIKGLHGYEPEELIGKSALDLLPPESQALAGNIFAEEMSRAVEKESGRVSRVQEIEMFTKNGRKVWVEIQSTFLLDENQRPAGVLGVSRDTTHRRDLESHLRQAQKMESIGTLAGGIAHDFNNILSAILGYAELARMTPGIDHKISQYQENILKAGIRAKNLIAQILSFSRNTLKERRPIQIGPIVKEALQLLRASVPASIKIDFQVEVDSAIILADSTDIHQIVMNLGTNAYQAIGGQVGEIFLKLTHKTVSPDPGNMPLDLQPGEYIVLTVHDTGLGMDGETREKIFDPYFTTKGQSEGTGLGLAVVHGIVKDLNGTIRVDSTIGKGTTFRVYLPVSIIREESENFKRASSLPRGNEHILFVDDEPMLVDIGQTMLSRLGYRVSTSTSGIEALELFRTHPGRFDVVVTDLNMPEINGDHLAEKMDRTNPGIPVVLCTGNPQQISGEIKAGKSCIRGIIRKPLSLDDLATVVRRALDEKK